MEYIHGCYSDIGNFRPNNEDAVFTSEFYYCGRQACLGIVCDGVGGTQKGEVASQMAAEGLLEWTREMSGIKDEYSFNTLSMLLKKKIYLLNETICKYSKLNNIQTGSTLSGVLISENQYMCVNIGDSRVYLVNNSVIQVTEDDVAVRIVNGNAKKLLTQCLGNKEQIFISSQAGYVSEKDAFIFCSDGFYKLITEKELRNFAVKTAKNKNTELLCKKMIELIKKRGERDNISCGVVKCV